MNRIAAAAAGLVLLGGFAVAVPVVAESSASAEWTQCVDQSLMTADYNRVQKDKAQVKAQQAKVKKIAHEKPTTEAGRKAKQKHLTGAKQKLQRDKSRLRHDEQTYGKDQTYGLCDPASGTAGASASPSAGTSGSTTPSPSPTTGSTNPLCPVLGVLGLC